METNLLIKLLMRWESRASTSSIVNTIQVQVCEQSLFMEK